MVSEIKIKIIEVLHNMKIMIHSDNHWAEKSSIINSFGYRYSKRLEQLIKSINWAFDVAKDRGCKATICCGDFFDKPNLTQQELTALQEIKWPNDLTNYFLVGNHESEEIDLHYSSTEVLKFNNNIIISEPTTIILDETEIDFLPYIPEFAKQPILDYFPEEKNNKSKHKILISHNDISGISYGPIVSSIGFEKEELAANFDLVLNGHIHNQGWITNNLLNVGSFSAHNFTNDSFSYRYGIWILDTDSLEIEFIENPYAFNFYKIEINSKADLSILNKLSNNAVVSIKCKDALVSEAKELIARLPNIIEHRIVITRDVTNSETAEDITDLTVDQYVKFAECCKEKLENNAILEEELSEILK